jgi:hypothetical protein
LRDYRNKVVFLYAVRGQQLLHIRLYKITVVPEIKLVDYEKGEKGFVTALSDICMTDLLILS